MVENDYLKGQQDNSSAEKIQQLQIRLAEQERRLVEQESRLAKQESLIKELSAQTRFNKPNWPFSQRQHNVKSVVDSLQERVCRETTSQVTDAVMKATRESVMEAVMSSIVNNVPRALSGALQESVKDATRKSGPAATRTMLQDPVRTLQEHLSG